MRKNIPALSSKERPRDIQHAGENINQSVNSLLLLGRENCIILMPTGSRHRNCKIHVYLVYVFRLH